MSSAKNHFYLECPTRLGPIEPPELPPRSPQTKKFSEWFPAQLGCAPVVQNMDAQVVVILWQCTEYFIEPKPDAKPRPPKPGQVV